MPRGGIHPPACRLLLKREMPTARRNGPAMSRLMKAYHQCRIDHGAVKPKTPGTK